MNQDIFGAITDAQFWKDLGKNSLNFPADAYAAMERYMQLPAKADAIAEERFPGSARDNSTKNAFRHALGTGMLAQELCGGPVGAGLAKGAGYLWEALGASQWGNPAYRQDTLHDLNANAVGARMATQTKDAEALARVLEKMALQSVPVKAPGVFERSPGYLTRSER